MRVPDVFILCYADNSQLIFHNRQYGPLIACRSTVWSSATGTKVNSECLSIILLFIRHPEVIDACMQASARSPAIPDASRHIPSRCCTFTAVYPSICLCTTTGIHLFALLGRLSRLLQHKFSMLQPSPLEHRVLVRWHAVIALGGTFKFPIPAIRKLTPSTSPD